MGYLFDFIINKCIGYGGKCNNVRLIYTWHSPLFIKDLFTSTDSLFCLYCCLALLQPMPLNLHLFVSTL